MTAIDRLRYLAALPFVSGGRGRGGYRRTGCKGLLFMDGYVTKTPDVPRAPSDQRNQQSDKKMDVSAPGRSSCCGKGGGKF